MHYEEDFIKADDSTEIPYRAWRVSKPDAVVMVIHGMAEHCGRYEFLGNFLTENNIALFALDLPGHGEHCDNANLGQSPGWSVKRNAAKTLWAQAVEMEPGVPVFLLGHSMGSYLLLDLLQHNPDLPLNGAILTGSGLQSRLQLWGGIQLTRLESMRQGKDGYSKLIEQVSFGQFNNAFKPAKTEFDWLSRNIQTVMDYIEDPYCGFPCSNFLWQDLLKAQYRLFGSQGLNNIPNDLPILLLSGDKDPVGRNGKGVQLLETKFKSQGHQDIQHQLYLNGRHEILNETNRAQVLQDLLQWVQTRLPESQGQSIPE